jgi:hypothetical protein
MKPEQRGIANYFHFDPVDVASLQKPRFLVRIGNNQPFIYSFPTDFVEKRGAMPPHEWEKVRQAQRRFYRKIGAPEPAAQKSKPSKQPESKSDPYNVERV